MAVSSGTRLHLVLIAGAAGLVGCSPASVGTATSAQTKFSDLIEVVREIRLEESPEVINVSPRVTLEDDGGFLVADPSEGQVRLYRRNGELSTSFGRKGRGPGEFDRVGRALRMESGRIVTVDIDGRLTVFDSLGGRVLDAQQLPVRPIYDAAPADDSLMVLSGRLRASAQTPLVHVWDVRNRRMVRSFFQPVLTSAAMAPAFVFTGGADVAVRGDTVAVLFSLADTVYMHGMDGLLRAKHPLRLTRFRPLRTAMPREESHEVFQQWLESFSTLSSLHWGADGDFVVQYYDLVGHDRHWTVVKAGRGGRARFELPEAPMLLAVSDGEPGLFFVSPAAEAPNVWVFGRTRW